jgi:two-component system response regulator YesN
MSEQTAILIADDEFSTRKGILKTLQVWSNDQYHFQTAENGIEALEYAQKYSYDLLITDIRMPGLNGIQLIEELQKQGIELTSLLLTGYADFEYARSALKLGAVNYLLKPVEQQSLIEAVEDALAISKERKKLIPASIHEINPVKNESIKKALEYIESELSKPTLSMKELAGHIHLNPSYASVLFKEETKETFSDYVTRQRLIKAKQLLIETDLKIYAISENTGFSTSKYFVKVFREQEGMTPREYRKHHLEK